jgi:hypothetical protein
MPISVLVSVRHYRTVTSVGTICDGPGWQRSTRLHRWSGDMEWLRWDRRAATPVTNAERTTRVLKWTNAPDSGNNNTREGGYYRLLLCYGV